MKPRVLHFVWGFAPGGTEHQLLQLLRLLKESGRYEVSVAALRREGALLAEVEAALGEPVTEFPTRSFYGPSMARELRRFVKFVRERGVNVLHAHDFYANVFAMLGGAWAGAPARVASKRETLAMRTPAQDFVERHIYRLAHMVVANAGAVRGHLLAAGVPDKKIHIIYNGLDLDRVSVDENWRRDDACASFKLPADRRFVTIVANLKAVKDHATFLRAAVKVRAAMPDAGFVLAGEGDLRDELKAQAAQLGIGGDVFLLGPCARLADLLNLSYAGALSSRAEGFSNSILEYAAAARPVVVTDVGGAREAVREGETGFIVAPGDDEALAARLIELLRDETRARTMGARGRQLIAEQFSTAAQLQRTEELYDKLTLCAEGAERR
jgi:glycosyltransferase involved in cell wall biosynthesis